jgi:hypothetical protein
MPFLYGWQTKQVSENYNTSGSANTPIDYMFIKPGASRVVNLMAARGQGKGAALTALSGLAFRIIQWTSTSGAGGTGVTPNPVDNRAPAAVATMGMGAGGGTGAVTSGTGGPNYVGGFGVGGSGPSGWTAQNPDGQIALDGNANKSIDFYSSSPTSSMAFENWGEIQE